MLILFISAIALNSIAIVCAEIKSPIIIVPGVMGHHVFVEKNNEDGQWKKLPFDRNDNCLTSAAVNDLTLEFNPATRSFQSPNGINIMVPITEDTCNVEYFTANPMCSAARDGPQAGGDDDYFHTFVEHYVAKGYERGKTIRSAPYDWRLAPGVINRIICMVLATVQLRTGGYYEELKSLIEKMNADRMAKRLYGKVTLVAHSIGAPIILHFLNTFVNQGWKSKHIHAFITLSGAWSGGIGALQTVISGKSDAAFAPIAADKTCRPSQVLYLLYRNAARTFPGVAYLFPKVSERGNGVMVTTPTRIYTANDYGALFRDIGYPQGFAMHREVEYINEDFCVPNVPVYCFFGTGIQTPENLRYDRQFPNSAPQAILGYGDGTVSNRISHTCLKWSPLQPGMFSARAFPGIDHLSIVKSSGVLRAIDDVVLQRS